MLRDKDIEEKMEYRFIVVLFYLKTPELVKIESELIASFDLKRRTKAVFKLILHMLKIFMLTNIVASGFFWISDISCDSHSDEEYCWVNQLKIQGIILKSHLWTYQYGFSLYWASTTMLTIGYGDITPSNLNEVVYTISAQFISCVLFGFSVNSIWNIVL